MSHTDIISYDLMHNFEASVKDFSSALKGLASADDATFADKINSIIGGMIVLVPVLLNELDPEKTEINVKKSEQVMRVNSVLKDITSSLYKKREFELKEEIDVNHPKIQKVMEWMIEAILDSLKDVGVNKELISAFVHNFSVRMVGFEESSNKKLKGVSFSKLETIENPLIDTFNDLRKGYTSEPA